MNLSRLQRSAPGLLESLQAASADPREWVRLGIVRDSSDDADFGLSLTVELTDGRPVEVRPLWPFADGGGGDFGPIPVGAEVVVLFPNGDTNAGIAVLGPANVQQRPDDAWDGGREINAALTVRAKGASREAVLTRTLLDDLSGFLSDLHTFLGAVRTAAGIANAAVTSPAYVSAVATAKAIDPSLGVIADALTSVGGALAGLNTSATALQTTEATWRARVDAARAGEGDGPFCSTALKAEVPS